MCMSLVGMDLTDAIVLLPLPTLPLCTGKCGGIMCGKRLTLLWFCALQIKTKPHSDFCLSTTFENSLFLEGSTRLLLLPAGDSFCGCKLFLLTQIPSKHRSGSVGSDR